MPSGRDFNPRTPVGCDIGKPTLPTTVAIISIHAPQWGATYDVPTPVTFDVISIHAPQWGATVGVQRVVQRVVISIHAPQWGATRDRYGLWIAQYAFQSTHPSGVRPTKSTQTLQHGLFQSTHPSGVRRRAASSLSSFVTYFNPRTPVGCDIIGDVTQCITEEISIHAPQWGATTGSPRRWRACSYFNPRTPMGCDVDGQIGHVELERISIHAPQWGATRCDVMDDFEQVISRLC